MSNTGIKNITFDIFNQEYKVHMQVRCKLYSATCKTLNAARLKKAEMVKQIFNNK